MGASAELMWLDLVGPHLCSLQEPSTPQLAPNPRSRVGNGGADLLWDVESTVEWPAIPDMCEVTHDGAEMCMCAPDHNRCVLSSGTGHVIQQWLPVR